MPSRPGPKPRWTAKMREQIEEMMDRGMSQAEIAKAFNTSQQTISRLTRDIHAMRSYQGSDTPWDVIATDPATWLAGQPDMLTALIRISRSYDAKVTSGPVGVPRPDWDLILRQRGGILTAWGAEKARREASNG